MLSKANCVNLEPDKNPSTLSISTTFFQTKLSNGLRIGLRRSRSKGVYCGVMVHAGSRYDPVGQEGIAHLVEHMLFKGTGKRTGMQILRRLEEVGGSLEAFTTKDYMCLYAVVPRSYFPRAVELLSDLLFDSVFPDKELSTEIKVVEEEIHLYKDTPSDLIMDVHEEFFWENTPLAHPILGSKESVNSITREQCMSFAESAFRPDNMVFTCIGDVSEETVTSVCRKYLDRPNFDIGASQPKTLSVSISEATHFNRIEEKPFYAQSHVVIGGGSVSMQDPHRLTASLLLGYLVGDSSTSLLNVELREKRGLVYTVEGSACAMRDTGYWQIYFGCDEQSLHKAIRITNRCLDRVCAEGISPKRLKKWIIQTKGRLMLEEDDNESTFLRLCKEMLYLDKVYTPLELSEMIETITTEDTKRLAATLLEPSKRSILVYKGLDQ